MAAKKEIDFQLFWYKNYIFWHLDMYPIEKMWFGSWYIFWVLILIWGHRGERERDFMSSTVELCGTEILLCWANTALTIKKTISTYFRVWLKLIILGTVAELLAS